jgi:hypothetical protein
MGALAPACFAAATATLLYLGWQARADTALTPEHGAGYALGVAGTAMMALMLLYPVRKHARFMRGCGAVRHWFRAHMVLGVLGPVCILFHCNFQSGSLNAEVALAAMLVVAGSGVAGRYLYAKIHHGLYGSRAALEEIRGRLAQQSDRLSARVRDNAPLQARLAALEPRIAAPAASLASSLIRMSRVWMTTHVISMRATLGRTPSGVRMPRESRRLLQAYLAGARRVASFTVYERLFALWHVLHVPLFVMLLVTAIAHVVAVHRY